MHEEALATTSWRRRGLPVRDFTSSTSIVYGLGMMLLWLALASTLVDGPCGVVDVAVAKDAVAPDDSTLREAAATAESAGDGALAVRLLRRLRDRTRDEAIRAEASDALDSVDITGPQQVCEAKSSRVALYFHEATFLGAAERERMSGYVLAELRARDLEAKLEIAPALEACDKDERCIRGFMAQNGYGAAVRLLPLQVGPLIAVDVAMVGFKAAADHRFELDSNPTRWSPVLSPAAVDDAARLVPAPTHERRRDEHRPQSRGGDAIIAGVAVAAVGGAAAAAGTVLLLNPELTGVESRDDTLLVQNIGITSMVFGGAIVVGGIVAVALIVDAKD